MGCDGQSADEGGGGVVITTYSYDAANQLVAEESASGRITYTYDPNGNMTVRNDGGARTTYTWDAENRLVGVDLAAGGPVTMTYDADGLRRRLETPTEDTRFVWDDQNVLLETDAQGATQASYTLAPRRYGDLLSQRRGSDSRFYLFDGLGSTDRLLDEDEAVTDSYTYEAFGTTRASSGTTPNPYPYKGRLGYREDAPEGPVYVRARYLAVSLGVFMSRDPLPDETSRSPYVYASNQPLLRSDPSGRWIEPGDRLGGPAAFFDTAYSGFVYTCACGWLDMPHLNDVEREVVRARDHLRGYVAAYRRGDIPVPTYQAHIWSGVGIPGKNYKVGAMFRSGMTPEMADTHPPDAFFYNRWSGFIAYAVRWGMEEFQDFHGLSHLGFSYEDLASNAIGALLGSGAYSREEIAKKCGVVPAATAKRVFDAMEADKPTSSMAPNTPRHRNLGEALHALKVPLPKNPLPEAKAHRLFHTMYGSTKGCCAKITAPGFSADECPDMFASEVIAYGAYVGRYNEHSEKNIPSWDLSRP
jgi:RHS repeat-associated protein